MIKNFTILLALVVCFLSEAQTKRLLNLEREWKFTIGDREEYPEVDYDDSGWEEIEVPSTWEDQGFLNYNGYAWYRFSFDGEDLQGMSDLTINLGYIDDVHQAYFNGEMIGFKGSFPPKYYTAYNALNIYSLPEELINHHGKNTIAVKVYDLTQGGGIVDGDIGIYYNLIAQKQFHSLEGVWKFSTRRDSDWEEPDYDDSYWDKIVVPSMWRSKFIKSSGGYGWYRKEFRLPESLKDKDIYVVLGLIDDFDYTYLNGEIIGRTKDNRSYGMSRSYQQYRVYKVYKEDLNQEGINVIAVQVEDIGGNAGIYEGPVGLAAEEISKRTLERMRDNE